jgi:hypothetical protein
MKRTYLFLFLACMLFVSITGRATVVTPYTADFNTTVNTSKHDFKASPGWGHIVGTYSDSYVTYTYQSTSGVDGSGCLKVGTQDVGDGWDYETVYDLLVTPAVTGDVSIMVKKSSYSGSIKFYNVTESNGKLVKGAEISVTVPTLSTSDFVKVTIPSVAAGTRIGIWGKYVYIDNFTAASADVVLKPGLTISGIKSFTDASAAADKNGDYTVKYKAVVTNTGEIDLEPNNSAYNYSLAMVNYSTSDTIVKVPITQKLSVGAVSDSIVVSKTLNIAQYPNRNRYDVCELVSGTSVYGSWIEPIAYAPKFAFADSADVSNRYASGDNLYFGMTKNAVKKQFVISNTGTAPMDITAITVPQGFACNVKAPLTLAPKSNVNCDLTMLNDVAGIKEGDFIVKNNAADFTLHLKGTIVDPTQWFVDFELGKLPNNMIAENNTWSVTDYPHQENVKGNNYCAESSTVDPVKLISPLLQVAAGDKLVFDGAKRSSDSFIDVYYSADRKTWTKVRSISATAENAADKFTDNTLSSSWSSTNYDFSQFVIDNIPAGNWYVAFSSGYARIDNILGYKVVDVAHDMIVTETKVPASGVVNHQFDASIKVKNVCLKNEPAGSYTATLFFDDQAVAQAPSTLLESGKENEYKFTFTPHAAGTFKAYAVIKAGDYTLTSAPTTVVITNETASQTVTVGNFETTSNKVPADIWYTNSESQTLYTPSILGLSNGNKITKLTYKGYTSSATTSHIRAYIENTTDTQVASPYQLRDTTAMTKIFDGDVTFSTEGTYTSHIDILTIPLAEPFTYTGGSLRVVMTSSTPDTKQVYFEVQSSNKEVTFSRYADGALTSLYSRDFSATEMPVVNIDVMKEAKVISGVVTSKATNSTLSNADVKLSCGDVMYTTKTDASGFYTMPVYQDSKTYELMAFKPGYEPKVIKGVRFSAGNVTMDVALEDAKGFFIETQDIPATGIVNHPFNATCKALNTTVDNLVANNYTATLYVGGKPVAYAETKDVASGKDADFTFSYYPHESGTFDSYVEFIIGGYRTVSATVPVTIYPEQETALVVVGDSANVSNSDAPVCFWFKQSESQSIYTASQINLPKGTVIKSIAYRGYLTSERDYKSLTRVYIENTSDEYTSDIAIRDTAEMTRIYNDSINITAKGSETNPVDYIVIPIEDGFVYDGQNLRIAFSAKGTDYAGVKFVGTDLTATYYRESDKDVSSAEWQKTKLPVAYFIVSTTNKISGKVMDEDGQPIKGANVKVKCDEILYTGKTDKRGLYSIKVAQPKLNYEATYSASGYFPTSAWIEFDNQDVVKDVKLQMVTNTISGIITDYTTKKPLEGVSVKVEKGDDSFVATTDAQGKYDITVKRATGDYMMYVSKDKYVGDTIAIKFMGNDIVKNDTIMSLVASAINANDANGLTIYGSMGAIVIVADAPAAVYVYDVSGKLISVKRVSAGETRINVPRGVYVINRKKITVE